MSIWKAVILAVALSFLPTIASAQEPTHAEVVAEPVDIPLGRFCQTAGNGPDYICFNAEEYVQLMLLHEQAWYHYRRAEMLTNSVAQLEGAVGQLMLAIDAAEEQKWLLEQENERLYDKWVQENRLRHEAEAGSPLDWLPWGLAAGEAAIILGIVLFAVAGG